MLLACPFRTPPPPPSPPSSKKCGFLALLARILLAIFCKKGCRGCLGDPGNQKISRFSPSHEINETSLLYASMHINPSMFVSLLSFVLIDLHSMFSTISVVCISCLHDIPIHFYKIDERGHLARQISAEYLSLAQRSRERRHFRLAHIVRGTAVGWYTGRWWQVYTTSIIISLCHATAFWWCWTCLSWYSRA